jgi:hypothetical protein
MLNTFVNKLSIHNGLQSVLHNATDGDAYVAKGFSCNPIQRNGYVLEAET